MARDKNLMPAEHRAKLRVAAKRTWADPAQRAKYVQAMCSVDRPGILAAVNAKPRRAYKLIAADFQVSERYVQLLAKGAGIRRYSSRKADAAGDHHQAEAHNG